MGGRLCVAGPHSLITATFDNLDDRSTIAFKNAVVPMETLSMVAGFVVPKTSRIAAISPLTTSAVVGALCEDRI
jgi:hypothetical protein